MDPIRPKYTPPNVQGPRDAAPAQAKEEVKKSKSSFEVGGDVAGPASTGGEQAVARPAYDAISAKIQDLVGKSMTREQVLGELVQGETQRIFGSNASPEMTSAVTQAFKNDPHLSAMFNQLYNKATRQGG